MLCAAKLRILNVIYILSGRGVVKISNKYFKALNDNFHSTLAFKKALDFYINSSLHVALAVVAFTVITYLNFHIPIDHDLLLFIFFGTITGYNFIKYAGIAKFQHFNLSPNLQAIQILSFTAFVGLIITLGFQSMEVLISSSILGSITLLYAFPFSEKYRNLRGIPGLKIYIIAFVVAGVTVLLPLVDVHSFPEQDHLIDLIQRCMIAIVLILPFEIRDMLGDHTRLGTIPQKFGVQRTKVIGYSLTCVFILIEFLKVEIHWAHTISLLFLGIISIVFLKRSSNNQGDYFASFWVEAAPWFWLGIFYILQWLI